MIIIKTTIFVPKRINVGFQNRSDTYTKKLAYITYYDEKGKLRKETSWNGWRDKNIPNEEYDNEPVEGFVLNKKVGDYHEGWFSNRQAYIRIFDPRGFEFEITVNNLLYILEHTSCIKGKGLEGEFIYGWDGKHLVLLPIESPDYKEIKEYSSKIQNRIKLKGKDLVLGATYLAKNNEQWVYLGRYNYYDYSDWSQENCEYKTCSNKGKYYWFAKNGFNWRDEPCVEFNKMKTLNSIISIVEQECSSDYPYFMGELEHNENYSPYDNSKDKYEEYTLEEVKDKIEKSKYNELSYFDDNYKYKTIYLKDNFVSIKTSIWVNNYIKTNQSIEEFFNTHKMYHKLKYLQNGKLYERL